MTIVTACAPVRISFGGGGTDLAAYYRRFGGYVVSAALAHFSTVTAAPYEPGAVQIISHDYGIRQHIIGRPDVSGPLALPRAVAEWFWDYGLERRGVTLELRAAVPPGTGLGSSSAMAVALIAALGDYLDFPQSCVEIAELASRIEIVRLAMPIGKQDQYASAHGGINAITFRRDRVTIRPLQLGSRQDDLERRLLLFSTGKSRHSGSILRQQQAETSHNPAVIARLHHLKTLAHQMEIALSTGNYDAFGTLLDVAWQSKKGLSGGISDPQIDVWYETARAAGALGGKITGAGGGGFLLLYTPPDQIAAVRSAMQEQGLAEFPVIFAKQGVHVERREVADSERESAAHEAIYFIADKDMQHA